MLQSGCSGLTAKSLRAIRRSFSLKFGVDLLSLYEFSLVKFLLEFREAAEEAKEEEKRWQKSRKC